MSNGHRSEPVSNVDTAWLRMEERNNLMMITGVMFFAGQMDMDRLKATLEQRFLRYDRFRQRIVAGGLPGQGARWEIDPNFTIDHHLHRFRLPAPADQATLQKFVSYVMSQPLDFSRPLWDFHLIENYQGGSALVVRVHHSIGDGIAMVSVMLSIMDTEAEPPPPDTSTPGRHKRRWPLAAVVRPPIQAVKATLKFTEAAIHETVGTLDNPSNVLKWGRMGLKSAGTGAKLVLMSPDPKTVFKGPLHNDKGAAWSRPIPLNDVKAVGRVLGGTVNDVLLAAVTGALRRYLEGRDEQTDGLNIRAVVPVNLRPINVVTPKLGNYFGLVFLGLPVGTIAPEDRLHELKQRMDRIKDSPEALFALGILQGIGLSPAPVQDIVVSIFGTKATAVMTNVPGPREQLYLAGQAVTGMMFWVPQSGRLGMGVSILSYAGQVTLGVATDLGLIPDPDAIIDAFHAEFDEFMGLVRQADGGSPTTDG